MAAKKAKTEPALLEQAKAGDAQAMFRLSLTLSDDAEAALWLNKAAAKGVAPAQNNLGVMLAQGRATSPGSLWERLKGKLSRTNPDTGDAAAEAVHWYRQAAERGDAHGQCNYGWRLATGNGVPQNIDEAIKWYRLAADQNHALAL
ncbi:MAG: tetratricopeptide repeat protein, partial [Verrucomicrobiota bacterium]|nr:tetratricopeptide repeat protein [Verrucomicrobiota bacterium]